MDKLELVQRDPKPGEAFLWVSNSGKKEIHTFHSDAGYGAKTFSKYNEEDGSSEIVSYSGIRGVIRVKEVHQ